jgi:bisphosphoglycerate-dependent phosphoglycerate mutase
LIRHGESTANVDPTFYSLPDCCVALTPRGIRQSVECSKILSRLPDINLWHHGLSVFCSRHARAQQTAQIVLRCAGLRHVTPILSASLNERHDSEETYPQTRERVAAWWNQHEYLLSAGDMIVFAHHYLIAAFIAHLTDLSDEEMETLRIANAVPLVFVRSDDGYKQV